MNTQNFILKTDSYKESHWLQTPPGTSECYSYGESRGGDIPNVLFFGLQYILQEHFVGKRVTPEMIDHAEIFCRQHFGSDIFNRHLWERLIEKHNGYIPLEIKAVPEGEVVPIHNVLYTIRNTDPEFYWLTNFAETLISHLWYTCTIASNDLLMKQDIKKFMLRTCDTLDGIDFKVHDFGYRGVSCEEQAEIGGMSHLVNFKGTDTIVGILCAQEYYKTQQMLGFSVPASEHFTMTSWGPTSERDAYKNMLEKYPTGIVSVVSDSYDIYNACENIWGGSLKDDVLKRAGKLVIRPDSGDPVEVNRRLIHILWDKFGGTINSKGFKVLDQHVGIIQGDGIDRSMVTNILTMCEQEGFSADNFVFGSGGGLLQKFNRDTMKFAIKASQVTINGEHRAVSKNPVTDSVKKSKSGLLKLVKADNAYLTVSSNDVDYNAVQDQMETVFLNGEIKRMQTFEDIRARASKYI